MMKKHNRVKQSLGALLFLVLFLVMSNPSQERHMGKLATTTGLPTMEDSSMTAPAIKTSALTYHSYLLFSTTTHRKTNRVYTLGLLWMVIQIE